MQKKDEEKLKLKKPSAVKTRTDSVPLRASSFYQSGVIPRCSCANIPGQEAISHPLHSGKNSKYAPEKLTYFQIYESFPTCLNIVEECIKEKISKTSLSKKFLNSLASKNYKEFDKWFIEQCFLICYPAQAYELERIDDLLELKKFYINAKKIEKAGGKVKDDKVLIEQAKKIPIGSLYSFTKIKVGKDRISASCPFHEDRTPSFIINIKDNTFKCFSCGAFGDSIEFVKKLHRLNFIDAINYLTARK